MKKILILSLIIRLICLYLFRNVSNYDLQSYLQVGQLTLKGINIYPEIANLHHPYFPFFLYLEAFAVWLGKGKITTILILKFIYILFDLGVLYLVYLLSKKNLRSTFVYAVNPVTILITTLHGQFDIIPLFFLLLSLYLIKVKKQTLTLLVFSFAILIKTWPLLFIISICKRLKNKKLIFLVLVFPILSIVTYSVLFKTTVLNILKTISGYQGLWGIWGPLSLIGKVPILLQKITTALFLISFFGYSWFNKTKNVIKNFYGLLIFFFVFTTNFSIQYFVWIIPFLILIKPKKYPYLIFIITLYLISFYCVWTSFPTVPKWLTITQNIIGFMLWVSFVQYWYLSNK